MINDISLSVKYFVVNPDKIKQSKIYCIDLCESEEVDSQDNQVVYNKVIGPKLYEKTLINETLKTSSYYNINDVYEDILDKYYELYLTKNEKLINWYYSNDYTELKSYFNMLSHKIAYESRRGKANTIIIPDEKYLFLGMDKDVLIINKTDKHKNKIFLIRTDKDSTSPGLSLFTTKNISSSRYNKLIKILYNLGKTPTDYVFDYILTDVGLNCNKLVEIIHISK